MKKALGLLLGVSVAIVSQNSYADGDRPWTHYGLRPLGMGNAFTAIADDFNALYYNPAGLARIDSWDGEFFNPSFTLSENLKTVVQDSQQTSSTNETIELIEENSGNDQSLTLGLSPHLIFPHFGFGASAQLNTELIFRRNIAVDTLLGIDIIAPISFAMNFFDDKLSIGVTGKLRVVSTVDQRIDISDLEALQNRDLNNEDPNSENPSEDEPSLENYVLGGIGVGADVGILFTPTKTWEPTIGVAIIDIGGTHFEKVELDKDSFGKPDVKLASVNVGFSLKPYDKNNKYLRFAMDMQSINQPFSFSKKLHAGAEFGWGQFLKIQAGSYKGAATFGVQLDAGITNLRLVTYKEQLGAVAGQHESRRLALQLKLLL